MGAVFALGMFGMLFIIAGALFFSAILFLILKFVLKKKGLRIFFLISSILSFIASFILAIIPVCFIIMIVSMNVLPPEDFVETDIQIEENGYQKEKFTADGKKYYIITEMSNVSTNITPIYSYIYKDIFESNNNGNYFRINDSSFDIVCDKYGTVFCSEEQMDEVLDYYFDDNNAQWFYEIEDYKIKIDEEMGIVLSGIDENKISDDDKTNIDYEDLTEDPYVLMKYSKDGIMFYQYLYIEKYSLGYLVVFDSLGDNASAYVIEGKLEIYLDNLFNKKGEN